ncbi:hypothetical protein ACJMK2_032229 [Sinanodonta woodiana]|uniref:Uncharacterized protein n=1 Tax=Sinanodonta woodiana TaxID=1069815 RepID=A0ABD3X4N3_SINWO
MFCFCFGNKKIQKKTHCFGQKRKVESGKKAKVRKVLDKVYTSSDKEGADGWLVSQPPSWESDAFQRSLNLSRSENLNVLVGRLAWRYIATKHWIQFTLHHGGCIQRYQSIVQEDQFPNLELDVKVHNSANVKYCRESRRLLIHQVFACVLPDMVTNEVPQFEMSSQHICYIVVSVVLHFGLGTVNFALKKPAVLSSTLDYIFKWTAEKAVDGNSDGSNPDTSRTCSATYPTTSIENHTWEVDIGFQIIVKTITVYGRTDKSVEHLRGFKLYIGNVSMPWIYNQNIPSTSSNDTLYVFKPKDAIASVISLKKEGTIIVICEVTVEGAIRKSL